MFPQMPNMIQDPSQTAIKFFENAIFKPLSLGEPYLVPWVDENKDQVIFASNSILACKYYFT
jgi:hypothetical protein